MPEKIFEKEKNVYIFNEWGNLAFGIYRVIEI